jgi:hypothetical protein
MEAMAGTIAGSAQLACVPVPTISQGPCNADGLFGRVRAGMAVVSLANRRATKGGVVMLRRTLTAVSSAALFAILAVGSVSAGQPGAECGDEGATLEPPGFLTDGFANAETHYAGSDGTASLANANSDHAVSQYDIACVHYTASH